MKQDTPISPEQIYDIICGNLVLEGITLSESAVIQNEFYEGGTCAELYDHAYRANQRLCRRLGVEQEDGDVETIFNSLLAISRILGIRMYHCGAALAPGKK